jgi:ferrochelatase
LLGKAFALGTEPCLPNLFAASSVTGATHFCMADTTGVLIIQLGTPDAPTPTALRRYLRQFLSDPRVIETNPVLWWFLLNFRILLTRPRQSAEKYRRIWKTDTGSPLLYYTRRQAEALQERLPNRLVRFGMQIGNPGVSTVVSEMIQTGITRLVVLPMYPQYSAPTTASALDVLFTALKQERRVPALRIIPPYFDHAAYLDAVTAVIRDNLAKLPWEPDYFLVSFHGIPVRYAKKGDPYPRQVEQTIALLHERLKWPEGKWSRSFQSVFGREPWLQPYTDATLRELAGRGVKRVFVATPGFTADCLETLDEIGFEAREIFRHAGGEELFQCPCLNDHPAWIEAMRTLVLEEGQGWI